MIYLCLMYKIYEICKNKYKENCYCYIYLSIRFGRVKPKYIFKSLHSCNYSFREFYLWFNDTNRNNFV